MVIMEPNYMNSTKLILQLTYEIFPVKINQG